MPIFIFSLSCKQNDPTINLITMLQPSESIKFQKNQFLLVEHLLYVVCRVPYTHFINNNAFKYTDKLEENKKGHQINTYTKYIFMCSVQAHTHTSESIGDRPY